ncbi:zinc ribbon domain-containing protein, partial [bacterium]|nr:zinc ribbon domain-containing protein [bacterium]
MNCPNCHSKNSLLANFCAKCGNPFTEKLANFKKVAAVPNDLNALNTIVYQYFPANADFFWVSVADKVFVFQEDGTNSQNINLGFAENERIVQKPVLTGTHLFIPTNQRLFCLLISTPETFCVQDFQVASNI